MFALLVSIAFALFFIIFLLLKNKNALNNNAFSEIDNRCSDLYTEDNRVDNENKNSKNDININIYKPKINNYGLNPPIRKISSRRIAPEKRGGGRTHKNHNKTSINQHPNSQNPEISIFKVGSQWDIKVEFQESFLNDFNIDLFQNNSILEKCYNACNCWILKYLNKDIIAKYKINDSEIANSFKLSEKPYLIFKLLGDNLNYGLMVSNLYFGTYAIVVQNNFKYSEASNARLLADPEATGVYNCSVYLFDINNGASICFIDNNNEIIKIYAKKNSFYLEGNLIENSIENYGPLFGGKSPEIKAISDNIWLDIDSIIIGEEGPGKGKWRKIIYPTLGENPLSISDAFPDKANGWYFIRIYNKEKELVESLDFRFVSALKKIEFCEQSFTTNNQNIVGESKVILLHDSYIDIKSVDSQNCFKIEHLSDERTIISIPLIPIYDLTNWVICQDNEKNIPLRIILDRIWWSISDDDQHPPVDWINTKTQVKKSELTAQSSKTIWIKVPQYTSNNFIYAQIGNSNRCIKYKIIRGS